MKKDKSAVIELSRGDVKYSMVNNILIVVHVSDGCEIYWDNHLSYIMSNH